MKNRSLLSFLGGFLIIAIVGLDYLVLGGEEIFQTQLKAAGSKPVVVNLDRVGEKHTLIIRTGGEIPVVWSVIDPSGVEIVKGSDFGSKKGVRRDSFVPAVSGNYSILAKHRGKGASEWSFIDVYILVNDKRTISAWLDI